MTVPHVSRLSCRTGTPSFAAAAEKIFDELDDSWAYDGARASTLLLHGDTLCTDDVEYQAFRRQTRDPAWQTAILAMSIEERLQMARAARDVSMEHTGSAPPDIMDVNPEAVSEAFREHKVLRMIHGHTHRPARHQVDLGDARAERIVLADWYTSGSYLEVSPNGAVSKSLQGSENPRASG